MDLGYIQRLHNIHSPKKLEGMKIDGTPIEQQLYKIIEGIGKASTSDIVNQVEFKGDTIRKCLKRLAEKGLLKETRGKTPVGNITVLLYEVAK